MHVKCILLKFSFHSLYNENNKTLIEVNLSPSNEVILEL